MWLKAWALIVCALVNAYLLAVMVLFATVIYPGFGAVEAGAFPAAYAAFTRRIGVPVVLFEFLALLSTLPLYAARPVAVPLWAVHVLVALGVIYFVITFGFHLPAHRPLGAGQNDPAALATLLSSQWWRTVVQLARVALLGWLSARAIRIAP